jgi:hypothetical protein
MVKQKLRNSVMKFRYSFSGIALFICFLSSSLSAKNNVEIIKCNPKTKTSFAIFVDKKTFEACKDEILKYRDVLQEEGLGTYILASEWKTPEDVKNEIIKLSKLKPALEGMIFVGDIPIVRVRKGQHLTTAFKMNENTFPMVESSVTSDRYYDDLDLKFDYIGKDGVNDHYFYYNLKGDSEQVLTPDFYSSRVIAPKSLGDKYDLIRKFFNKTIAAHKENNELDKFTYFAGHGYNSDCMTTWRNQTAVFKEHFPLAYTDGLGNKFLNFRQDPYMKYTLYSEMQRPDLDAFLFYEHGAYNIQYINGEFPSQTLDQNIESLKRALRANYRRLKGDKAEKFAEEACTKYGFSSDIFSAEVLADTKREDSIANVDINISLEDLSKLKTGARFTMLNACYNGSFHQDDYVAGYHIFNEGRTVVTQGNTVNVLQDKYADELIGYLSLGIRVGFWQKEVVTLESHLIGDPTFRFSTKEANNFNNDLVLKLNDVAYWNSLLQEKRGIIRAMALKQLSRIQPAGFSDQAFAIFTNDPSKIVRMQALKALTVKPDQNLTKAVAKGLFDPYEMLRRTAAHLAGEIGDPSLISPLVEIALYDSESQRVSYAAQSSLQVFDLDQVLAEYKKQIKQEIITDASKLENLIENDIALRKKSLEKQLANIMSADIPLAAREQAIRLLRNYQQHTCLDKLLAVLKDSRQPNEVRVLLCEALGWFNYSTSKEEIILACNQVVSDDECSADVKAEALKTIKRLQ